MRFILILFLILLCFSYRAQFADDFADGDFTSNPSWVGETGKFVVSSEQQLRLFISPQAQGTAYLSTASQSIENAVWEFFVRLDFNPSNDNFARVYLVSNSPVLDGALNGYFVLIGLSQDKISLFRQTGTTRTEIIQGISGSVNLSNVLVKIKVTRDALGNWTLMRDVGLSGTYTTEGEVFDNTHFQSSFSGVYCQFTQTRSQHFYFDDFIVTGDAFVDSQAPVFQNLTFQENTQLTLTFNESLSISSANVSNFSLNNSIGNPITASINPNDNSQIILDFATPFVDNTIYTLYVQNISDLAGNIAPSFTHNFLYFEFSIPQFGEIRINELMVDENPSVGMPLVEYVELYNTTSKTFQLQGYRICNDSGCGTIQSAILGAYGYLVITPTSGLGLFPDVNSINATSFPGLKNAGDEVSLRNPTQTLIIDQMKYDLTTYQDVSKSNGGYSLELINPYNPCLGMDNWRATESPLGGTPGMQNSVFNDAPDTTAPFVVSAFPIATNTLELVFNERMEAAELLNLDLQVEAEMNIINIFVDGDYADKVLVLFDQYFELNKVYHFTINNLVDCSGNEGNLNGTFVLPHEASVGDIVINEILFNPVTGGSDYVELYNNSNKFVNLKSWYMANLSNGVPANFRTITKKNLIFEPHTYYVLTADSIQVKQTYVNHGFGRFIQCDLPTYANASGNVILVNNNNLVIDSVSYSEKWHFRLVDDRKGKALERINPSSSSNNPDNWQTASETVGWGTPGIQNSQYLNAQALGEFNIIPTVISPDNDGFEDFAIMRYELPEVGMLGSIKIYDENSRLVRELVNNFYFDQSGELKWDGLNDDGFKCRIGRYLVFFEAFSIQTGAVISIKKAVVVAGRV
jgi:hypothetical protein